MLTGDKSRFETALTGGPVHPSVASDVDLARTVAAVRVDAAPDPEFVAILRDRLLAAAAGPVPLADPPRRLHVGRRIRLVAVAVAVAIVGLVVVVAAARAALPGQPLYVVREATERVGARVAGDDRARGATLLDQATRNVSDVHALVAGAATPADVVTALDRSTQLTQDGSALLFADFAASKDPTSLQEVQSFTERLYPDVAALQGVVPPELRPQVLALRTMLADLRLSALSTLAACDTCGPAGDDARAVLGPGGGRTPDTATTPGPTSATAAPAPPPTDPASRPPGVATGTGTAGAGSPPGSPTSGTTSSSPASRGATPTPPDAATSEPAPLPPSSDPAVPPVVPTATVPTTVVPFSLGRTSCPPQGCG